jgi:molecular chaperone GrpE
MPPEPTSSQPETGQPETGDPESGAAEVTAANTEPTASASSTASSASSSSATASTATTDDAATTDDTAALRADVERLQKELGDAKEQADRYHSNWQRSAADFLNWKRRTDQEKADLSRFAEGALTVEMLRILDDFERAFVSLPPDLRTLTWIEGVYLIGQKLYATLQQRGLSPIVADGQEFDPHLHEAVLREDDAEGADALVVVQELQRGYRFHDRVIRPTLVKVGRPKAPEATDAAAGSTAEGDTGPDALDADSPSD